jgi:hypothetical protein
MSLLDSDVIEVSDELIFKKPVKFSYHFYKMGQVTKLLIYKEQYNPIVWQVDGVTVHGSSESKNITPANFMITRGWGRKFKYNNGQALIFP